ncbi:hypothetical protein GUJ93_ZPchr0010g7387 [Zizania palustris]|uniref:Uncharacterized protein n=1 Tax=Zizania palustris TaxID=103762 RepID=A0A8J5TDP7_ZIZPA|nr:hypothetical protein GUJ93_ZPchr0010g7387 [Zizania palustris]
MMQSAAPSVPSDVTSHPAQLRAARLDARGDLMRHALEMSVFSLLLFPATASARLRPPPPPPPRPPAASRRLLPPPRPPTAFARLPPPHRPPRPPAASPASCRLRPEKFADTWNGFSTEAFRFILPTIKLATPSAVMVCLEYWAFELLVLIADLLPNPTYGLAEDTMRSGRPNVSPNELYSTSSLQYWGAMQDEPRCSPAAVDAMQEKKVSYVA